MTTQLALINKKESITEYFTHEEIDIIKKTICKDSTDSVLNLFIMQCKRTGLDPFARQIYSVPRKTKKFINNQWIEETQHTTQVSIDGFRLNAQRTGMYAGQKPVQWCGKDGVWSDIWIGNGYPFAARVGVIRKDFAEPLYAIAKWDAYAVEEVYNKDKTAPKTYKVKSMWEKMPDHMLAKVAEALALRQAFPQELSGLYTNDEMPSHDDSHLINHNIIKTEYEQNKTKLIEQQKPIEQQKIIQQPGILSVKEKEILANDIKTLTNSIEVDIPKIDKESIKKFQSALYFKCIDKYKELNLKEYLEIPLKELHKEMLDEAKEFWGTTKEE